MPELIAVDAGKRKRNASKAISAGLFEAAQRRGKLYWYAQWKEGEQKKSKELGLCSKVSRADAEALLASILQPFNVGSGQKQTELFTFKSFLEKVYLPIFRQKWKASTTETEEYRLQAHFVRTIGDLLLHRIDRERLQTVLNTSARAVGRDVLDHLRFRLKSIFDLAISEGVVERNPATSLFTPRITKRAGQSLS